MLWRCRCLAAALSLAALLLAVPAAAQRVERIARVSDGDTVVTARGERIRIVGLDAPELHGARCRRERRLAEQATAELRRLSARGLVLRREGRDRYGRTLARARTRDGRDVATAMVRAGLARHYYGRGRRAGWCRPR